MNGKLNSVKDEESFDYEAIVFACAKGNQSALRLLYERDARWLMGVALRIVRRRELADEVLHDAFLSIWQKSDTYSPALGSARGWIYSVVRHRALDLAQKYRDELSAPEVELDNLPSEGLSPLDALSRNRNAKAVHHCLDRLDEQKKACLLLAYVDGFSQAQIAVHLGSPLGTVKAWTRRALMILKDCLT